jgi:hypothetical protein
MLATACTLLHAGLADESTTKQIPIKLQHNRIIIFTKLNEKGPFTFLLDSACTIPTLHPTLVDELQLTPSGRVRINGIAGTERAPTYRNVVFDLGETQFKPRRVASIPSERDHTRRRDGVIGSCFFESFVVEFRPGTKFLKLHSITNFQYSGKGQVIPFRFREEIPVIDVTLQLKSGETLKADFEVDTGCDSGICIGDHFVKENKLVERLGGKSSEKFGIGGSVETTDARIPVVRIGAHDIKNVQADLFLEGSPVDHPLGGHIGMGVLSKKGIIFDYPRKRLIIE